MKIEYDKVHVKMGKMTKAVSVSELEIDGIKLGDILAEHAEYKQAFQDFTQELKDAFIVRKNEDIIIGVEDKIISGRLKALKPNKGENVKLLKVENGEFKKDKKKVGAL